MKASKFSEAQKAFILKQGAEGRFRDTRQSAVFVGYLPITTAAESRRGVR